MSARVFSSSLRKFSQLGMLSLLAVLVTATFAMLPAPAAAIGISPPSAQMDFVPGQRYDFQVRVINNNAFPIDVVPKIDGILADNIAVQQPISVPASGSTMVPISVIMPDHLPSPGLHTTFVFFTEKYVDKESGTFAVRTSVGLRVIVWQPFPGHYAELVATAPSVAQGNDTVLKVLVNNLGTAPIENGKVTVRVLDAGGALKDVFTFAGLNISGNSNQDYYDTIRASSYSPGRYTIVAKLEYADNVTSMNSTFAVGSQDVDVVAVEGPIYLDQPLNRITIHLASLWNLQLENVYAVFQLGKNNVQTPSITLSGFEQNSVSSFWETDKTLPVGQSLAKITVYYPGGSKDVLMPIMVYNETPKPPVYQAPDSESPSIILSGADLAMLCILLVCLVILVIYLMRRSDKKNKNPPSTAAVPPVKPASMRPRRPGV